jgi:hypothetical protein
MHILEIPQNRWEKQWCLYKCLRVWMTLTKENNRFASKALWSSIKSYICPLPLVSPSSMSLWDFVSMCGPGIYWVVGSRPCTLAFEAPSTQHREHCWIGVECWLVSPKWWNFSPLWTKAEAGWIKRENLMVRIFRIKALVFPRKRGEENGSPFQLP